MFEPSRTLSANDPTTLGRIVPVQDKSPAFSNRDQGEMKFVTFGSQGQQSDDSKPLRLSSHALSKVSIPPDHSLESIAEGTSSSASKNLSIEEETEVNVVKFEHEVEVKVPKE